MNRPTSYELHIKRLFASIDIDHMSGFGIDLATYHGVRVSAPDILTRLKDVARPMPPRSDGGPWPDEWVALFERWMNEEFPQ